MPSIPSELLVAALYGGILLLVAVGQYLERRKQARAEPKTSLTAASMGIGIGYGEREQMERVIEQLKRIADALTDKNTTLIESRLEELAEKFDLLREKHERDVLGMRAGRGRPRDQG